MPNPWPYMYRAASVGLFGLPIKPFGWARSMSQSTARRRLSAYLPSRRVEPSMSMVMPARAVIEVGYWPPLASQWPSRFWVSANHLSPLSTASRTLGGSSSARAGTAFSPAKQVAMISRRFMTHDLPRRGVTLNDKTTEPWIPHGYRRIRIGRAGTPAGSDGSTPAAEADFSV